MTLYNNQLEFYQKNPDGNWGNISTYTLISSYSITVNGDGRIGLGQWSEYNNNPSKYYWVVVRNYVDPEPSISVGYWYYRLVFHPQPPVTSTTSSASPLPGEITSPLSLPDLNDGLSTVNRNVTLGFPLSSESSKNTTLSLHLDNSTEERIKELVSNLTPVENGP